MRSQVSGIVLESRNLRSLGRELESIITKTLINFMMTEDTPVPLVVCWHKFHGHIKSVRLSASLGNVKNISILASGRDEFDNIRDEFYFSSCILHSLSLP